MKYTRDQAGLENLMVDAVELAHRMKIDGKTAVRRLLGTADNRHDPERMAAAEAKRARRRQRAGGASA